MSLKSRLLKPYSKYISNKVQAIEANAIGDQLSVFKYIISKAQSTQFGKDHGFENIKSTKDFKLQVPIRDYEKLRPYIDRVTKGEKNILWPGIPKYLAKTSGTTSGVKYIPLTSESTKSQIFTARLALLNHINKSGAPIFDGKVMFISGSPSLTKTNGIPTGRLSGIINHEIPNWVKRHQKPSFETNCIEDWETKLDRIVEETFHQNMTLISGIPPWVQMYFERLLEKTGKGNVLEVFPNLKLFAHGGVNYAPYKNTMENLIGGNLASLETYPASEGFIAFQNDPNSESLLLNTNAGIYYEFIELNEINKENPNRLGLTEVKVNVDYAVILSSDAGLWAYNIGDTIRFTSINPFKIIVSGRIKHFISAFGEHVITKEIEEAIKIVVNKHQINIIDFTVAPQVNPDDNSTPYHEWFIEFEKMPTDLHLLESSINQEMVRQNIYYRDLIEGGVLQCLKIQTLEKDAFRNYMRSKGKLGGQNKVPRLMNNRDIATELEKFVKN